MPSVMFWNLKGGVGKTVTTLTVAQALAAEGRRVVVVDADPQCASSWMLLGDKRLRRSQDDGLTLADYISQFLIDSGSVQPMSSFVQCIQEGPKGPAISAISSAMDYEVLSASVEQARKSYGESEYANRMRNAVQRTRAWLSEMDWVLFDCPPSLELQVRFMLSCAQAFVTPCVPDILSVRATLKTIDAVALSKYRARPVGTLWNLFRSNAQVHKRVVAAARDRDARLERLPAPFQTVLPNAAVLATGFAEPGPASSLSKKYGSELARELRVLAAELHHRMNAVTS